MENKEDRKPFRYNAAQMAFDILRKLITILEWARGTGKSTILGRAIRDNVVEMPRSTGVLVAETYAQIKTRTLPSTISGLEQHGLIKDLHYFVGKRPPKLWNWPEPYEPPTDYKNCIIFWNGTIMLFVSQDGSASSGRGLNVDWVVGDEAARLDQTKFQTDVLLTNRGNKYRVAEYPDGSWKYFHECKWHHSITLASSTPVTASGMWFLDFEEQAIMHPEKYLFLRASAEVNRHNLGDEYFETAKATMPEFLYNAEVLNIRITQIENGFYPFLNESQHCYNAYNPTFYDSLKDNKPTSLGDMDVDPDRPLIAGLDWGGNINCMVVAQEHGSEFKVLKDFYVKYPRIIDHLIEEEFVEYYKHHRNKVLYLWYDPSGNTKQANSQKTFAQQVEELLKKHGWQVQLMTKWGYNELHTIKYRLWIDLLKEEKPGLPLVRFNKSNCRTLLVSMNNARAIQGSTEAIKKDKGDERKKDFPQERATHLSDAMDVIVVGMFIHQIGNQSDMPATRTL